MKLSTVFVSFALLASCEASLHSVRGKVEQKEKKLTTREDVRRKVARDILMAGVNVMAKKEHLAKKEHVAEDHEVPRVQNKVVS